MKKKLRLKEGEVYKTYLKQLCKILIIRAHETINCGICAADEGHEPNCPIVFVESLCEDLGWSEEEILK